MYLAPAVASVPLRPHTTISTRTLRAVYPKREDAREFVKGGQGYAIVKSITQVDGIIYGLLEATDEPEMVQVLAEAFSRHDPLAIALGLSVSDVAQIVEAFAPKMLKEELTIVARDAGGEMAGVMFTDDFGTPSPDVGALPEEFDAIGMLLDRLDLPYRETHEVVPGSHLHLLMVGVSDGATRRGVAQALIRVCLDHGSKRGYRWAIAEATGVVSQHIFRKLGFNELDVVPYREFEVDGQRVFATIAEHRGAVLMERPVDPGDPTPDKKNM
jgi:ribosomal protein S18 acetylase RimI-like enzyme